MKRINDTDVLRNEKWSEVYRETPESVNEGVLLAFERIRILERRRRWMLRGVSLAACLCLVMGVGALMLGGRREGVDHVTEPAAQARVLTEDAIVYASMQDEYFHVYKACSEQRGEAVELPLVTALEFEKRLCPVCGANVLLPAETQNQNDEASMQE